MMGPLYAELNTHIYHPILSERDTRILQWWVTAIRDLAPRRVLKRTGQPDIAMFADAATATSIIAAVAIIREDFIRDESAHEVLALTTGEHWGELFDSTNLIYGPEMLAQLTKLYRRYGDIRNKNITFLIDNGNAFEALVKNNAKPTVITEMTHLIWHRLNTLRITPWFEWAPGARNIADLPTRNVEIPLKCVQQGTFLLSRGIYELITHEKRQWKLDDQ